jgi:hypothetical protein
VEGVKTAVEEFFTDNKLEYTIREENDFKVYEVIILCKRFSLYE